MSILKIELKKDIWSGVDKALKLFIGKKANKFFSQNKGEYTEKNAYDFRRHLEVDRTIQSKFWDKEVITVDIQPIHTLNGIIDRLRCFAAVSLRIFSERGYQEFIGSGKELLAQSVVNDLRAEIVHNIFVRMHSCPGMDRELLLKMFDDIDRGPRAS